MTDTESKYWAFLSFSPQDNCEQRPDTQGLSRLCWADWLHDALKTFSIPSDFAGQINGRGEIIPERIHPIFRPDQEQPKEACLSEYIRKALEQSICLIVICSPRSAQCPQVNEAVRYFKQLGRGKRVLPIVVAGEPNAGDGNKHGLTPEDECFVPALRHPVHPDGTIDTSRRAGRFIFVDARHGVEKREILAKDHRTAEADLEMAKIQLIALLLGVGFNGLWWREQKRHFFDYAEAQRQAREALQQAEETRRQLQEAQQQTREAQSQALELQNLPRDVHAQIQEAQKQVLEAHTQAREAQNKLEDFENIVRDTQTQLEESRHRTLAAEGKVLEAQLQAREAQNQLETTRNQTREAQNQVLEMQNQTQDVPNQIKEAQAQVLKAQSQAQNTQSQLEEARQQTQEAQSKFLAAQSQILEFQDHARSAQSQIQETKIQIQIIQNQRRRARRLTKVFALLAVLALLAAGLAASVALRQRKSASQALAKAASAATGKFDLERGGGEPIQQLLKNIGGAEQDKNRRRSLDELSAAIPREEISEALKASSVIMNDQQRSHFQKRLLIRLGWVNPISAMTYAETIEGKIVNETGLSDSPTYFQLAVLENWMKTDLSGAFNWACQLPDTDSRQRGLEKIIPALAADNPHATLTRLNDLQTAPSERIYMLLFLRWADQDPAQAIQHLPQIPNHDLDENILCAILTTWVAHHPEDALNWVKSQPESTSKNKALETCIGELEKTDPATAMKWIKSLDFPKQIMQPKVVPLPWTQFLLNSIFASPAFYRFEPEITTNDSAQIKSEE